MEEDGKITEPDNTAARTALWRGLHGQVDATPDIPEDEIGVKLLSRPHDWQQRPDMKYIKRPRPSVVARARFIDDLIIERSKQGVELGFGVPDYLHLVPVDFETSSWWNIFLCRFKG